MFKFILKSWIRFKIWYAKKKGWIGNLNNEVNLLNRLQPKSSCYHDLSNVGFIYKSDKKTLGLFDVQYDTVTTHIKGGDCNSIHRVIQVIEYILGHNSYLVTYLAFPFNKSHTTVLLKFHNKYISFDYGYGDYCGTIKECLNSVAKKYKSKVLAYVVQDINWRIL